MAAVNTAKGDCGLAMLPGDPWTTFNVISDGPSGTQPAAGGFLLRWWCPRVLTFLQVLQMTQMELASVEGLVSSAPI